MVDSVVELVVVVTRSSLGFLNSHNISNQESGIILATIPMTDWYRLLVTKGEADKKQNKEKNVFPHFS